MPWGVAAAAVAAGGAYLAADKQSDAANNAANSSKQAGQAATASQAGYRQAGDLALDKIGYGLGQSSPLASQSNFDGAAYLKANPDVAANSYFASNPYAHYQQYGQGEGRQFTYTPASQAQAQSSQAGSPGAVDFTHQFNANDLNAQLAPNYQFMLSQGQQANQNAAGVGGGLVGGNALQGLNKWTQDYAQNSYQQAYNNYTNNQTNIYNRLASLAGLGQTATQASTNAGLTATQNANNYLTSGAAASAGGIVGAANAANTGAGNYLGWQYLNGGQQQSDSSGGPSSWGPG